MQLDPHGSCRTLTFATSAANQKVVITYNAECWALSDYVFLNILVDGTQARPQENPDFAACSAESGYVCIVGQSVYTFPRKGSHAVTVRASASAFFALDASSLVVAK